VHKRDKDKKELIERAEDFEQLSMKRLEKVSRNNMSLSHRNVTASAPPLSRSSASYFSFLPWDLGTRSTP
jgi:hypothetical protein